MGEAGVSLHLGTRKQRSVWESLAGVRGQQCLDHHFTVRVSPYDKDGKLLAEVQPSPTGNLGDGDKKVQAYGFRLRIARDASNQIPFSRPPGYDPKR
jgi:hypothetical protein